MYNSGMNERPPLSIFLEKEKAPHRVFYHEQPIHSMQEAARARNQDANQLIRCIIFRTSQGEFILVMVAGPSQLSWGALRAHLGLSRMTMASKVEVLKVTGYPTGTVAPLNLLHPLRLLADQRVFAHDEISFGSGQRNTAIIMNTKDFQQVLGEVEIGDFIKKEQQP